MTATEYHAAISEALALMQGKPQPGSVEAARLLHLLDLIERHLIAKQH